MISNERNLCLNPEVKKKNKKESIDSLCIIMFSNCFIFADLIIISGFGLYYEIFWKLYIRFPLLSGEENFTIACLPAIPSIECEYAALLFPALPGGKWLVAQYRL
jgi:hypothetical protein